MTSRLRISRPTKGSFKKATPKAAFAYRDLGISVATDGRVGADISRLTGLSKDFDEPHFHKLRCHIVYVTKGWVKIEYEGEGKVRLEAGDCVYQPPRIRHRLLDASGNVEILQVTIPANVETVLLPKSSPLTKPARGGRKRT
jgi:quercetin dioxygenase-like cupin family protein